MAVLGDVTLELVAETVDILQDRHLPSQPQSAMQMRIPAPYGDSTIGFYLGSMYAHMTRKAAASINNSTYV